jgi:hypothetical protein
VNVRTERDARSLGNHVSIMLAGLPLGVEDPRERFQMISREVKELKAVDQAGGIADLLRVLGRLPAPVQAGLGKRLTAPNIVTNLLCTNVRGPETPLYCLGHQMVAHYPWVLTTWRMGLGVAVMTYMKDLWFSFTGDASVLPDMDRVAGFLADDFRALHSAIAKPVELVVRRGALPAVVARDAALVMPIRANGGTPASPMASAGEEADDAWRLES